MGCGSSLASRVRTHSHEHDLDSRSLDKQSISEPRAPRQSSIQDEARSFRSKTGAIKLLCRNEHSFNAFFSFLREKGRHEFLVCYCDIEEIKLLDEDQLVSRTAALLWRYKTVCEAAKARAQHSSGAGLEDCMELSLWECFGKLRHMHITECPAEMLVKHLVITQNEILSRLVLPFEEYLCSPQYKKWQGEALDREKARRLERERERSEKKSAHSAAHNNNNNSNNNNSINGALWSPFSAAPTSPTVASSYSISSDSPVTHRTQNNGSIHLSVHANNVVNTNSVNNNAMVPTSLRAAVSSAHILIVDDSTVTLKLTGLTLERDGHCVERAMNGQIALNMMKSRAYDVVLIDCNMPVMDGFEAVRLFREIERQREKESEREGEIDSDEDGEDDQSDVSSLSDEEEMERERENRKAGLSAAERAKEKAERRKRAAKEKERRREERRRAKERIREGDEEAEAKAEKEEEERERAAKEIEREKEKPLLLSSPRLLLSSPRLSQVASPRFANPSASHRSLSHKLSLTGSQQSSVHLNVNPTTGKFQSFSFSPEPVTCSLSLSIQEHEHEEREREREEEREMRGRQTPLARECFRQLIIGMSTNIDEETRQKALTAGMDAFLPKPFTLEKFIETIRLTHYSSATHTRATNTQRTMYSSSSATVHPLNAPSSDSA